jgi:hypothetical protein
MSEQQAAEAANAEPTDADSSSDSDTSSKSSESNDSSKELDSGEAHEIGDDQLPEDLQPTEDNPLARHPRQTDDEDDKIGADSETGDADDPSAAMTYGNDDDPDDSDGSDDSDKSSG